MSPDEGDSKDASTGVKGLDEVAKYVPREAPNEVPRMLQAVHAWRAKNFFGGCDPGSG